MARLLFDAVACEIVTDAPPATVSIVAPGDAPPYDVAVRDLPDMIESGRMPEGALLSHGTGMAAMLFADADAHALATDQFTLAAFETADGSVCALCRVEADRHDDAVKALAEHYRKPFGACRTAAGPVRPTPGGACAHNPHGRLFRRYSLAGPGPVPPVTKVMPSYAPKDAPAPKRAEERESERALAGLLLVYPESALPLAQASGLNPDDLTDADARKVFGACLRLHAADRPIDPLAVAHEGGVAAKALQALMDNAPAAAHAGYHLDVLRGTVARRKALLLIQAAEGETAVRLACERAIEAMPGASVFEAIRASEWLDGEDEPHEPVVAGLFDRRDRVAIVGQSKGRKSWYAMQLAMCVAAGVPFLRREVTPARVLVVNGEITRGWYRRRMRWMSATLGIGNGDLERLAVMNLAERAPEDVLSAARSAAKRGGFEVVVIDPFYLCCGNENDQDEVKRVIIEMKRYAEAGVTLVSVFHAAKGQIGDRQAIDRISGSGIFARDCSTLISLCEHASEADHVVMQPVLRNHPPQPAVTLAFADCAFTATEVEAAEKSAATKGAKTATKGDIAACFTPDGTTYAQTVDRIKVRLGVGTNRAKELLGQAVRDGLCEAVSSGRCAVYRAAPGGVA